MTEIIPRELQIREGGRSTYWSDDGDLESVMRGARQTRLPFSAEGGYVLFALDVDGTFDHVVVAPPAGRGGVGSDLTEMMLTASALSDKVLRALEQVMAERGGPDD